jgi:hypothetical protein
MRPRAWPARPGAAAIAATGVVMTSVAGAIRKGGKQLDDSTPQIRKRAAETVTKPLLLKKQELPPRGVKPSLQKRRSLLKNGKETEGQALVALLPRLIHSVESCPSVRSFWFTCRVLG